MGLVVAVLGAMVVSLLSAPSASADGLDNVLPHDTHGLSAIDYRLSFNNGAGIFGAIFTPETTGPAAFAYVLFAVFMAAVVIGFTPLNILLLADWLSPLVRTIDGTANRLYDELGLPFILFIVIATLMATVALFFLRNHGNRVWHHTTVTVVCVIVGAAIVFPVAEAAKMLGIGRDSAVAMGQSITGGTLDSRNPTGVLVDEWVRKPVQRWTYGGQDMDSLTDPANPARSCGLVWDEYIRGAQNPASADPGKNDSDKIKDAPLSCPGGALGTKMHDAAMNPANSVVDSMVTTVFGLVMCLLLIVVVLMVLGTSVVALIHAGLIKLGMMGAGAEAGQNFLIRNSVDAPIAGVMFFAGLLGVYIGAAVAKILAQVVPSSLVGMLLTILLLAGVGFGVVRVIRNLRHVSSRISRSRGGAGGGMPASALVRAPVEHGRSLANSAVNRYKMQRAARKAAGKVAAVAAPEIAAPTAAAARVRAAAQRVFHRGGGGSAAAQTTGAAAGGGGNAGAAPGGGGQPAPAYAAAPGGGGGGWMITPMAPGQYARMAASQYRNSRSAMHTPVDGQGQRVAGRPQRQSQRALAAAGRAGAPGFWPGTSYQAGGYSSSDGPVGAPSGPSAGAAGGGAAPRRAPRGGGVRSASGTAGSARAMAQTYRKGKK